MRHVPHLFLPGVWSGETVSLDEIQVAHVGHVLRMRPGEPVSYTDGAGRVGSGHLGDGAVVRSEERAEPRPSMLVMAVAPPANRDRQRFVVEKLAELGVARLVWLKTRYGQGHAPPLEKQRSWAAAALEQSRGAWIMETSPGQTEWGSLPRPLGVCEPSGAVGASSFAAIAVGPEGGWAPGEVPPDAVAVGLGPTILRVETAAVVAAATYR